MSSVKHYAAQIEAIKLLIRDAYRFPEYEEELKKYAICVLDCMKDCHNLYMELQELHDEADQLKGGQRNDETEEQFGERVERYGQHVEKILEIDAKIGPQTKAASKAVDDLNKYTKKMLDDANGVRNPDLN